ncbi:hypothetical protein [Mesorhizobium sp. SP-1A]|uniref:hypothetical protein n=1 Tax=Mesorhizobium sp. SP-1A TaxID=3077840 RepID=UPI0028F7242B|nr:hypothetical protein [Mesorhizobium sp. SP-1A]
MQFLASKFKEVAIALMILPCAGSFAFASGQQLCDSALNSQAAKSGLPTSLAQALASNLSIGPGGKMYPFAVQHNGKTYVENSPENALRLIRQFKSEGAQELRVGCLGITINRGHDDQFVWNALNPNWNVSSAMSGINSSVKTDIGAPLAAITNNSAPPIIEEQASPPPSEFKFAETPPSEDIILDKNVGNERSTAAAGAVKSTWGLFNNKKPSPLTSP